MTKEALSKAIHREPFQPFILHLADGRNLRVPHREFVSIHPKGLTVIVYGDEEDLEILDVLLITSLEVSRKAGRN